MSFDLVKVTASYYELSATDAEEAVHFIKKTVTNHWKMLAEKYRLSRSSVADMAPAFGA